MINIAATNTNVIYGIETPGTLPVPNFMRRKSYALLSLNSANWLLEEPVIAGSISRTTDSISER